MDIRNVRFGDMKNLVLFKNYGLVYSYSQMDAFQHSVNRKAPINPLDTETLHKATYSKILDVVPLDDVLIKYLIVEKHGIYVETIGQPTEDLRGTVPSIIMK